MNGLLSPVGVLKTLFPLCLAPPRVSQHIVILTTELHHRFFTRFLSGAIVSKSFFFFTNESGVISKVMHTPAIASLSFSLSLLLHWAGPCQVLFSMILSLFCCSVASYHPMLCCAWFLDSNMQIFSACIPIWNCNFSIFFSSYFLFCVLFTLNQH